MDTWERRFRAPTMLFPSWARDAPHRLVVASNETGTFQLHAWDRSTGTRRQVTDETVGVLHGFPTPDGSGIVWFFDTTGDEVGHWVVEPFDGSTGPVPLVDGVPDAWSAGIALSAAGTVAVGTAAADGFAVHVAVGDSPPRVVHRHRDTVDVAGVSRDGARLCLAHAEHGDNIHLALRVLDPRTGDVVGEQWDGEGLGLSAAGWAPVDGDHRLAITHERAGAERPGVWDVDSGERHDLELDVRGEVTVAGWWPDASALLLVQSHEGRDRLHRHDLSTGETVALDHAEGTLSGAGVRPDGEVWLRLASGARAAHIVALDGDEVVAPDGDRAPDGEPYRSWHFENALGQRVHGFVVTPPREGPFPVVVDVHGGPFWAWSDDFRPDVQAWVDHGFAVALVNYRGSTGYGVAWRDAILGNPGFPELDDTVAGLDALVGEGIADAARAVLVGGSWGGYITLLGLGRYPDRWAAGVAIVPVADYVAAYDDEAAGLQAFDRTLFGGSPAERPDLYEERSPITYVDAVRAPVLVIAGDNDSRCPIRQILNYLERLDGRGARYEVIRYDAGHGSMVIDERVQHMGAELDFVRDVLAGQRSRR